MSKEFGIVRMNKMIRTSNSVPKTKVLWSVRAIVLALLMLMCVSTTTTTAQNVDDIPAYWCRNGLFSSDKAEFKLAKVGGNWTARIHFLNDADGCPSPEVKCETKSYLITGDQVLVSRK